MTETARAWVGGAVAFVAAAALAGLGTVWHHALVTVGSLGRLPVGLALGVLALAGLTVFVRAWRGFAGVMGAVAGAFLVTQVLAQVGPGGDVLIQGDAVGYAWMVAAPLAALVPALLRRRRPVQASPR